MFKLAKSVQGEMYSSTAMHQGWTPPVDTPPVKATRINGEPIRRATLIDDVMSRNLGRDAGKAMPSAAHGGNLIGKVLTIAGIGAALGGGTYAAAHGFSSLHNKLTKQPRFNKMLEENPDLKALPKKDVMKMFDVIHEYGPDLTKSPTVAGSFVRKAMEYKDLGISPSSVKELVDISGTLHKTRSARADVFGRDLPKGIDY
jgi:hypothetical protein